MTEPDPRRGGTRTVTSLNNASVKAIRALRMRKVRRQTGLFAAEGASLLLMARDAGWSPRSVLFLAGSAERGVAATLAQWARGELVSHIDPGRRRQQLELSWPRHGALVRAVIPTGPLADAFGGQLAADSPRGNSGRTLQLQGSTPNLESIWSPMVLETGYLAAIFKVETPGIEPGSAVA